MEKHCSTIRFWLKKPTDKNGKSPITMVIAANGERAESKNPKRKRNAKPFRHQDNKSDYQSRKTAGYPSARPYHLHKGELLQFR